MWGTPAVWKQYNKMAVLHLFLLNSTLIYIPFSLYTYQYKIVYWDGDIMQRLAYIIKTVFVSVTKTVSIYICWPVTTLHIRIYKVVISVFLSVSDHNPWTRPICLKFWLGRSGDIRECYLLGLKIINWDKFNRESSFCRHSCNS